MKETDVMLGDCVLCDGKPYQVAEIYDGLICIDTERALVAFPEDLQPTPSRRRYWRRTAGRI